MLNARLFGRGGVSPRGAIAVCAMALGLGLLGVGGWLAGPQGTTAQSGTATPEPCPPATPASGETASADCLLIGEYDIYYKPNVITIPADTAVRVVTSNRGEATHNFSVTDHENPGVENLNISVTTDSGEEGTTTINAPAGTYYFFCDQPGHEQAGMRGYLTVKTDAEITVAEATVTPPIG